MFLVFYLTIWLFAKNSTYKFFMPTFVLKSIGQGNLEMDLRASIATRIIYFVGSLLTTSFFHTSFSDRSREKWIVLEVYACRPCLHFCHWWAWQKMQPLSLSKCTCPVTCKECTCPVSMWWGCRCFQWWNQLDTQQPLYSHTKKY